MKIRATSIIRYNKRKQEGNRNASGEEFRHYGHYNNFRYRWGDDAGIAAINLIDDAGIAMINLIGDAGIAKINLTVINDSDRNLIGIARAS